MRSKYTAIGVIILGSLVATGLIIGFYEKFKDESYDPLTTLSGPTIIDHNCVKLNQIHI